MGFCFLGYTEFLDGGSPRDILGFVVGKSRNPELGSHEVLYFDNENEQDYDDEATYEFLDIGVIFYVLTPDDIRAYSLPSPPSPSVSSSGSVYKPEPSLPDSDISDEVISDPKK